MNSTHFANPPVANSSYLDYDGMNGAQDAGYSSYTESPYSTVFFPSSLEDHYGRATDNLHYVAASDGPSPFSFEENQPSAPSSQSRPSTVITSYSPRRGSEGGEVFVSIRVPIDLHSTPRAVFLSFGSKQCECTTNLMGCDESAFNYMFSCQVPSFASTMSPSFDVPLQLVIALGPETLPLMLPVGVFSFERVVHSSRMEDSRKRRVTTLPESLPVRPVKRLSAHSMDMQLESDTYLYDENAAVPYSPFLQAPFPSGGVSPARLSPSHSPKSSVDVLPTSSGASQAQACLMAPSPVAPSWSPAITASATFPLVASHPYQSSTIASPPSNPTLIRTSTIQQATGMGQAQAFNPYAMYPTKAVLKLNGDLDSMTDGWTPEEREAQRRLVQFTRSQNGSTIHADFKPVTPEERSANSICISCIYWEAKDECFVTSVDTIYLLESLVGVRFTVEEKNRIRRNLEGFRPLTVSKAKQDSEEFFKVIMGFPAPKPRNIEKDVKVFPWKILSHALKKIIGK